VYTAYYCFPTPRGWSKIASFWAPHDGDYLHGLYSFIEDFWGDNGNLKRSAAFGPAWICTKQGKWVQLQAATFSHDGSGKRDRLDYDFGLRNGRFWLQTGGFEGKTPKFGALIKMPAETPPDDVVQAVRSNGLEK
jgi:hypothetical protein